MFCQDIIERKQYIETKEKAQNDGEKKRQMRENIETQKNKTQKHREKVNCMDTYKRENKQVIASPSLCLTFRPI